MKLGVALSTRDNDAIQADAYLKAMGHVEEAGLDGLWFFDAVGRGYFYPDPLAAISAAAAMTRRIELGTCIMQVSLRNPVDLAQRALTAHFLSGGRFKFGVGAGSTEGDFKFFEADFPGRFAKLRDSLETMKTLWDGGKVNGHGLDPYDAAKGGPPTLIGSWAGSRWIPIAAERHAGWIGSAMYTNIAALKTGVARFKGLGGKEAIVTNVHVDLTQTGGKLGDEDKMDLFCGPAEAKDRLALLRDQDFDCAILVTKDHSEANLAAIRGLLDP